MYTYIYTHTHTYRMFRECKLVLRNLIARRPQTMNQEECKANQKTVGLLVFVEGAIQGKWETQGSHSGDF